MSFIRNHLIRKIEDQIERKHFIIGSHVFLYFDEPLNDSLFGLIDRVNRWSPFGKDEIVPYRWVLLKEKVLLDLFLKLKNNKIYYLTDSGQKVKLKNEQIKK